MSKKNIKCWCGLSKGHKGPHLQKEDIPTNAMADSGASSGPIQTYDPLLFANKKKNRVLKRFSSFLKSSQFKK